VLSRNLENEAAKARYRAVKIQPQWVVTPGKQTFRFIAKKQIPHLTVCKVPLNDIGCAVSIRSVGVMYVSMLGEPGIMVSGARLGKGGDKKKNKN
jgi:hypothetical protein